MLWHLKEIITEAGVSTEYHKVQDIRIEKGDEGNYVLSVTTGSFVSKEYREKSAMNLVKMGHHMFTVTEEEAKGDIYALAYNKLKETEEFKDSEDI